METERKNYNRTKKGTGEELVITSSPTRVAVSHELLTGQQQKWQDANCGNVAALSKTLQRVRLG